MKKSDYDDFFTVVIQKCIDKVLDEARPYQCAEVRKNSQYRIYQYYQKRRDAVKDKYMDRKADVSLDRHKVASCMIYAILKAEPIKINRYIPGLPERILLANEYLAFFVALNIIEMYKREGAVEKENCEIILPRTYHETAENQQDFLCNICKALYYVRLKGIETFDVFAYSSILFLLEKYTDMVVVKD